MSFVYRKKMTPGDYVNYGILTIIALFCLFPFIYVFSVSFTDPKVYVPLQLYVFPKKWSLEAYRYILSTNSFVNSLKSTVFVTAIGTVLSLFFTFTFAYALTRQSLPGRRFFMGCVIVTLLFNAGIVPNYLLVKNLGLINSLWSLILISLTNAWSIIVVKSFMNSLPAELEEAAIIDGASDMGVFWKIIIPLSIPSIASFTLFFAVGYWNTYFNAMMYLSDSKKWTLQVLVKTLVIDSSSISVGQMGSTDTNSLPQETIRMSSVVLAMAPILVLYPFLQRYFVKGVMIGAIKG